MKKIAQCAVLLAFALAFVGCNLQDEPENPTTLQDALNQGGPVNLDEYAPSNSGTYTVSKDTVITGSADGANFTVTNGANVTFTNTGNIGKVTVKNSGSTITLQGENVAVGTVAALADCKLSSDNNNNAIGNVVVGNDVKELTLDGKTTVEKLALESSTATPTITVSKDVIINKADEAATNAVKTPSGTSASDQVKGTLTKDEETELKGELQESSGNFITSKEELSKCVRNIIKKYYDFANGIDTKSRAATASTTDISNQLKDAFNAVYKNPFYNDEEMAKSFIKLFTGKGATKDIKFEGKIDLTNIGVNNGLDAFIEFANYARDYFPSDEDDEYEATAPGYDPTIRKASDSEQITRESWFGSNYKTVNAFLDVADKYASVPKLYLLGKLDVKAAATGDADYASATAKANIEIETTKINSMIPELLKVYTDKVEAITYPSSANLPVTAIKPFINVDANVALTKNQYDEFVQKCKDMPGGEDEPEWNFQYPNFSYPEFTYEEFTYERHYDGPIDMTDWSDEEREEYWQKREEEEADYQQKYEEYWQKREEAYYAYEQERWEAQRVYWQKRNEAYYEYDKKWDTEWDAWYEQHRKDLKDYFLTAQYNSKSFKCALETGISTTVTNTATVPGGIITLSLKGDYANPGKIIALIMAGPEIGFSNSDDDDMGGYGDGYSMRAVSAENRREEQNESGYVAILKELERDFGIVPTVTVTDYNGNQTFSLSGIDNILDIITDIVENIGDIIQ